MYKNSENLREAVTTCFASNGRDKFPMNGRCAMNPSELNEKAWDKNGPLRDCKLCRTVNIFISIYFFFFVDFLLML